MQGLIFYGLKMQHRFIKVFQSSSALCLPTNVSYNIIPTYTLMTDVLDTQLNNFPTAAESARTF